MKLTISVSTNGKCFKLRKYLSLPVADPGEDQTEARREGPPPPYLRVWMTAPSPLI